MSEAVNPLVPMWYDVIWVVTVAVVLVLILLALISIARAAKSLSPGQALVWTLVALFVPILGPLAWMFIGKRSLNTSRPAMIPES